MRRAVCFCIPPVPLNPEENEKTVEYLLREYPEFRICDIRPYSGFSSGIPEESDSKNPELARTVRIFPHRMEGEGHYLALLKKEGEKPLRAEQVSSGKGKETDFPKNWRIFLSLVSRDFDPARIEIREEKYTLCRTDCRP